MMCYGPTDPRMDRWTDGQMDGRTYEQMRGPNFPPFYRTLSPAGAAPLKGPGGPQKGPGVQRKGSEGQLEEVRGIDW